MTPKRVLKTFHVPTWIKTNKNTKEKQYRLDYCRYIFGWNIKGQLFLQYPSTMPSLGAPCLRGSTPDFKWRDDRTGKKSKPPKNPLTKKLPPPPLKKKKKFPNGISKPQNVLENWYNTKNTPQNPYLIKTPKIILAKFSHLKKSWNRKFQTPQNPSIISVRWNLDYLPWAPCTW